MVNRICTGVALILSLSTSLALSQRPRINESSSQPTASVPTPPPAPATVKAKYEGGVFGYPKKMDGTLNFDDMNKRLVFRNDKQKEMFPLPYDALTGAYADTHRVRPKAATIGQVIPDIGLPIGFIKTKVRYLTIQYNDPDSKVSGVTSFRLDNKDIIDSVLATLASKAGLTKRGEVYVRKKD